SFCKSCCLISICLIYHNFIVAVYIKNLYSLTLKIHYFL
ncbi:hypothetical protein NT07LI_1994a, partial [Listeria innocua FSL S4-378]